ncbi:MAG TPA: hypothetical protein VK308_04605 [Pyrinomonadaceae bacterium]|nr:hypothetical protein [Pyrinomonadaceae bacterium]
MAVVIASTVYCIHSLVSPHQAVPLPKSIVEEIPTIDFCELLSHPELYDQRVIRIKARYFRALENSRFEMPDCRHSDMNQKVSRQYRGVNVDFISNDFEELEGSSYSEVVEDGIFIGRFNGTSPCNDCPYWNYKFTVIRVESKNIIKRKII